MRRSMLPILLSLCFVATACSRGGGNDADAAYAAQAAAEAAAAAADAAPDASASGNSAEALKQMGVEHLAREMTTRSEMPAANYSVMRPGRSAEEAMLAYEHEVTVRMDAERIPVHVKAVREACERRTHGACLVLAVGENGGRYARASIRVRAEAKAIEPLIRAAGDGGEIADRSTRAEDLSTEVRDNTLRQDRLRKEHARLLEFQGRSDLKVADMIALSEQLSNVESELAQAEREGAEHTRRIETQQLSLEFLPPNGEAGRSDIAEAFRDSGRVMAASTAGVIRVVAALVPVLLALVVGIWLLRRAWRFVRRRRAASE
jgi:hypothetical protein